MSRFYKRKKTFFTTKDVGKGTTFTIYFPIIDAISSVVAGPVVSTGKPGSKLRIMLVDDEEMIIRAQKQILQNSGYEVIGYTNSNKAI
ncbi:hypothetical protein ACFL35_17710 [Candidatus Riflebacteria bacterium]